MVKLITSVVALVLDNNDDDDDDDDDDDKWFSFTKCNIFAPKTSTIDLTSEVFRAIPPKQQILFHCCVILPYKAVRVHSVLHCTIRVDRFFAEGGRSKNKMRWNNKPLIRCFGR